jgi:hypothetical protein
LWREKTERFVFFYKKEKHFEGVLKMKNVSGFGSFVFGPTDFLLFFN